jgi:hypothetical protein
MDYNNLQIDLSNLHLEWLKQPMLRKYWGEAYAEAVNERDTLKKKMEEVKAELDFKYRIKWEKLYPAIKMTEGSLNNIIISTDLYKKVYEQFLEANKNASIIGNVLKTLDDRKYSLDNEVKLFIASYFDRTNISEETEKFMDEKNKEAVSNELKENKRIKKLRKKRSEK